MSKEEIDALDLFVMGLKSIGFAAWKAMSQSTALDRYAKLIELRAQTQGKYTQGDVAYLPVSPPPFFWDYKCRKCLWWQSPNGCRVVEGKISPLGWCVLWMPPEGYKPFTWPKELLNGDW